MEKNDTGVPWCTAESWAEANASLAHTLTHRRDRFSEAVGIARILRRRLLSLFPRMADLCARTCPACTDICCRRAWVWADFRDLLFLHLADIPVPEAQLLARQGEPCRYGTARGCRLDRLQRPFVCTWYVCPPQTSILVRQPTQRDALNGIIAAIKRDRRQMEDAFMHGVFR